MGGKGSGRRIYHDAKMTTDSLVRIHVKTLKSNGCLKPGYAGELCLPGTNSKVQSIFFRSEKSQLVLNYRSSSPNGQQSDEQMLVVRLDRQPCHYGGYRTWFRCPICQRRHSHPILLWG